ncbi:MAG: sulfatase [Anaerolineae bacterium]|nr:sulfatase [Anaerolineae bacterium]
MNRPNVVLIDCHDLGDWLGCYGRDYVRTPNLDRLAQEGALFAQHIAVCPICGPSRLGLWTSRYPHSLDVYGNTSYEPRGDALPLACLFAQHGYETFHCGQWKSNGTLEWAGYRHKLDDEPESEKISRFFAARWRAAEQPFLAHFSFHRVHRPFGHMYDPSLLDRVEVPPTVPDVPTTRKDLASLCHQITILDAHIGRILDAIKAHDLEQNTVVVFVTDHGIAYARAKHTLYDAGIRTALLIKYPPSIRPGQRCDALLSNLDLYPTLAELCHLSSPPGIVGRSFLGLLNGQPYVPREHVVSSFTYGQRGGMQVYTPRRCLRTARYKFIRNYTSDPAYLDGGFVGRFAFERDVLEQWPLFGNSSPPVEFYDLLADPWEEHNLADNPAYAGLRGEFAQELVEILRETGDEILTGAVPSKTNSPVIQEWVKPEHSDRHRLRFDLHTDTCERPFWIL